MSLAQVLSRERRWWVECGDWLTVAPSIPDGCVQTCVTSPPYFGLRDYQTATWVGGDPCPHTSRPRISQSTTIARSHGGTGPTQPDIPLSLLGVPYRDVCGKCGAVRIDQQIGLEKSPAEYVAKLVEVFREVRRVLHPTGSLWLNLGDSYVNDPGNGRGEQRVGIAGHVHRSTSSKLGIPGLKRKDLMGMPWRVAFALQEDGWWLRSAVTWAKKACLPESVNDRPTSATEMIFLLTKQSRYYYDGAAVVEKAVPKHAAAGDSVNDFRTIAGFNARGVVSDGTRQLRNFWLLGPAPFPNAHYAVFPNEIPRRCISAGSSERGCCPACRAPWRRVVRKQRFDRTVDRLYGGTLGHNPSGTVPGSNTRGMPDPLPVTIGWEPGCRCDAGDPVPCLVLDCFAGASTTGLVALRLGRRYLGVELNPAYIVMGNARIESDTGAMSMHLPFEPAAS